MRFRRLAVLLLGASLVYGRPLTAQTIGRITSTVTTARQIQLAVKFVF